MCTDILPLLVLVVLPVTLLLHHVRLTSSPWVRAAIAALILGVLVSRAPDGGFDTAHLDRVKLLLAASAAALLWSASAGRGPDATTYRFLLLLIAGSSVIVHTNFLRFHGYGAFIHDHDVAHYYLGSKYFGEIGYGDLYVAAVRADAEANGGRPSVTQARDLHTNVMVASERLLVESERVRDGFTDERWRSFGDDLAVLKARMGKRFGDFLADHGYNPTPVWALLGGRVANLVPAGSGLGMLALACLDPVLLALAFAALGVAFGAEIALLSLTYFTLMFGASFGWVGGGFLRQAWLASVMIGIASLQRGAPVPAGVLFAVATSLRVFPGLFVVGHAGAVLLSLVRGRRPQRTDVRFLTTFGVAGGALFLGTLLDHRGFADWLAFRANIGAHLSGLMSNFVGAPALLPYGEAFLTSPADPIDALHASGGLVTRTVAALFAIAGLAIALLRATRTDDPATRVASGIWPIALGLKVSAYYSTFLVALIPAFRDSRRKLALIFAVEACLYILGLFEVHFVMMCLFRSVLVVYLLIALFFDAASTDLPAERAGA